jgi:hypothetical protein
VTKAPILSVACALACSLPSIAAAQTVVVFPVTGDPALTAAHGEEALARVQADLEDSGITVLRDMALAGACQTAGVPLCIDPSCADTLLPALGAEFAVALALTSRNGLVSITVRLLDAHGREVSADADGAEGVIAQAARGALSQARARWVSREGSPIRVVGPSGARIAIDGSEVGACPYEGLVAPGTHHFVVTGPGLPMERDVEIGAAATAIEIVFEEVVVNGGGPDAGWLVTGIALAGVGIGAGIAGAVIATGNEHCTSGCDGPAASRVVSLPNTDLAIPLLVAGGVALAAGVVMVIIAVASGGSSSRSPVTATANGLSVAF